MEPTALGSSFAAGLGIGSGLGVSDSRKRVWALMGRVVTASLSLELFILIMTSAFLHKRPFKIAYFKMYFHLVERQSKQMGEEEEEEERSFVLWFTPEMPATTRAGPGQGQEHRALSGLPLSVTGNQAPELLPPNTSARNRIGNKRFGI